MQFASAIAGEVLAGAGAIKSKEEAAASKVAAKKELVSLAEEALKAGKPNVAARMLMMANGLAPGSWGADSTDSLLAVDGSVDSLAEAIAKAKGEDPKTLQKEVKEQADKRQADKEEADRQKEAEADREARQDQDIAGLQWYVEEDTKEIEQNRKDIDALQDQAAKDAAAPDAEPGPGTDTPKDQG